MLLVVSFRENFLSSVATIVWKPNAHTASQLVALSNELQWLCPKRHAAFEAQRDVLRYIDV